MSTSAIVYTTINENFPAAGVDNDSQGFRDNFARIKTALGTAQNEITYLNNNALYNNKNNDMGNNTLSNVILKNSGVLSNSSLTSASTTSVITYSEYQYRRYSLGNTENVFQIDNWPVGCYSEILLEMVSASGTKRAKFQSGVVNSSLGSVTKKLHLGEGFGNNDYVDLTRLDNNSKLQTYLFKVSTPDGGVNTFVTLVDMLKEQA